MKQCSATKSNGDFCGNRVKDDTQWCAYHRKRYSANVKHGKYASKEVLGVPKEYHGIYQDFLSDKKPFDLRREMALLRTLFVETRNKMEASCLNKAAEIEDALAKKLDHGMKGDPERKRKLISLVLSCAREVLQDELDLTAGLTIDEAKDLTWMLDTVSKVAERMKKIQEGVKLQVSIDTNILIRFLQQAIFPETPEPERRQRMLMRASQMGISRVVSEDPFALPASLAEVVEEAPVPVVTRVRPKLRTLADDSEDSDEVEPKEISKW